MYIFSPFLKNHATVPFLLQGWEEAVLRPDHPKNCTTNFENAHSYFSKCALKCAFSMHIPKCTPNKLQTSYKDKETSCLVSLRLLTKKYTLMATLAWYCTVPTVPRWRNSGRHIPVKIIYFLPCYFLFIPTAFMCTRIKQTPCKNIKY